MSDGRLERIWKKRAHGGVMDVVESAEVTADKGMEGDANYGAGRQITVISADAWDGVVDELGAAVDPSARRANLLVRGVSLKETRGRILEVGSCRILVQGETRPCHVMDEAHQGLRDALSLEWRGGVYGKVLAGGSVRTGDPVRWAPAEAGEETAAGSGGGR
jgi:MOSC domain-containing protein YiiM